MRKEMFGAAALCLGIVMSPAILAASFDGSKSLICATNEVFECGRSEECLRQTAESVNAPQFIWLDFEKKMALTKRPDGTESEAQIGRVEQSEGQIILQGAQDGTAWSLTIAKDSGKMAASALREGVGFVLFGACTDR